MCRYAFKQYKPHYACFDCQKSFKQPNILDWLTVRDKGYIYRELFRMQSHPPILERMEREFGVRLSELEYEYANNAFLCPECKKPMANMGLDFKPPNKSDVSAWRTFKTMFRVGHCFHTCGCNGIGLIPQSQSDLKAYLTDRRDAFMVQFDLIDSRARDVETRTMARSYWMSLISRIDLELSMLN